MQLSLCSECAPVQVHHALPTQMNKQMKNRKHQVLCALSNIAQGLTVLQAHARLHFVSSLTNTTPTRPATLHASPSSKPSSPAAIQQEREFYL